jgi:predicted Fe-S protein YdhL (DUF1289 family)
MSFMHPPATLSPCTGICTIAPLAGHCIGCGRTLEEIGNWRELDTDARKTIMSTLPGRLRRAGLTVPARLMETTAP